jgi:hypothetical protein
MSYLDWVKKLQKVVPYFIIGGVYLSNTCTTEKQVKAVLQLFFQDFSGLGVYKKLSV